MIKPVPTDKDRAFMEMAVEESKIHWGLTSPNPSVGTVLVKSDKVLGKAVTSKGGRPHSEASLLQRLGKKARGATMYVTLEPCSHYGKTPPCAEMIVQAGIAKVFIGVKDPNPLVNGKGLGILRNAKIPYHLGLLGDECADVNEWFFKRFHSKYPYLVLKAAATLDGKIATAGGESQWITGEESRNSVHILRQRMDAVMVGTQTLLADDPSLTVRHVTALRQPHRIVLDRKGILPDRLKVFHSMMGEQVFYFTGPKVRNRFIRLPFVRHFQVKPTKSGLDMDEVLKTLKQEGVESILCEGGGNLNATLLEKGYVDKLILYIAPKLLGGNSAPTFFEGSGFPSVSKSIVAKGMTVARSGEDIVLTCPLRRYA